MIKIVHLITGLNVGGAETMLFKLLSALDRGLFCSQVLSLLEPGPMADPIQQLGIPVRALGMPRGRPTVRGLFRLCRLLSREKPTILQTWMYHANLLGLASRCTSPGCRLVWNIRSGTPGQSSYSSLTAWVVKAGAWLSRWPNAIIINSASSRAIHAALGYHPRRWEVIPNGFDLDRFLPDPLARASVRLELGLPASTLLIGLVGRYHPVKGHETFVRAALQLAGQHTGLHFILVGAGVVADNPAFQDMLQGAPAKHQIHLLGERRDMPRLMASMDILVSASYSEGFPNVVGEAMACGVPCVVTDVGDAAALVGGTGVVVAPRDAAALTEGVRRLLDEGASGRAALGMAARQRIAAHYSLSHIVGSYESLYTSLRGS